MCSICKSFLFSTFVFGVFIPTKLPPHSWRKGQSIFFFLPFFFSQARHEIYFSENRMGLSFVTFTFSLSFSWQLLARALFDFTMRWRGRVFSFRVGIYNLEDKLELRSWLRTPKTYGSERMRAYARTVVLTNSVCAGVELWQQLERAAVLTARDRRSSAWACCGNRAERNGEQNGTDNGDFDFLVLVMFTQKTEAHCASEKDNLVPMIYSKCMLGLPAELSLSTHRWSTLVFRAGKADQRSSEIDLVQFTCSGRSIQASRLTQYEVMWT